MRESLHISEEDLILYALGTLKPTQLSNMTAHISLCNECRNELARIQVDLAAFAAAQPPVELPSGARERFLKRLNDDTADASKLARLRNKSRIYVLGKNFQHWLDTPIPLRILSGALAAALAFFIYDDLGHLRQIRQLLPEMKRFEAETAELTELRQFLQGSHVQQVSLHEKPPLNKAPEAHVLYAATTGKLVFTASNMPAPPAGKAYELWVLPVKGAPIAAGTFTPDLQGSGAIIFPQIPSDVQASGFGVTVEDAAGVAAPTSAIILSGH